MALTDTRITITPVDRRKTPVKPSEASQYELNIRIGDWYLAEYVTEDALYQLQDRINYATGLFSFMEKFNCNVEDARKIKDFWETKPNDYHWERTYKKTYDRCRRDRDCSCEDCYNCVINCQSPLERQMLLELHKNGLNTILQRRINKDGSYYDAPEEVDSENILTIPDFYIEKGDVRICIYADGHTYHERTESQAQHDRNIDRELQRLGFVVLRYTGNEIRNDCQKVIDNIKENLTH